MRKIDVAELSLRNGIICPEVWVAYKGLVYDVTSSPLFKNGKHYRLKCGADLTDSISEAPHQDDVIQKFPVVGLFFPG